MAPIITVTNGPTLSANWFCKVMMENAPTMGPKTVPMPPRRVIRTTSPEVRQSASVKVTEVKTRALVAPANPASVGDIPPVLASFATRMEMTTHPSQWPVVEKPLVIEAFDKGIQSILIGEKTAEQVAQDVQAIKDQQTAR